MPSILHTDITTHASQSVTNSQIDTKKVIHVACAMVYPAPFLGGGGGGESTNDPGQAISLYCTTVCQPHHTAKVKVKLIPGEGGINVLYDLC